jgi:hypothetical protein
MTDYKALKALCAELLKALSEWALGQGSNVDAPLIIRARTALAQPEPEGVTDEEIEREALKNADSDDEYRAFKSGAFFVQERISRPTTEPEVSPMSVPVPAPMSADTLAAIIREVDGTHRRLGAAALAEAILAHPAAINAQGLDRDPGETADWLRAEAEQAEGRA